MTVTPRKLKEVHPEFKSTAEAVVQSAIDSATRAYKSALLGTSYDDVVRLDACNRLSALSPRGEQSKYVKGEEHKTSYSFERDKIVSAKAFGYRVI